MKSRIRMRMRIPPISEPFAWRAYWGIDQHAASINPID
jgi:hypothetical protein